MAKTKKPSKDVVETVDKPSSISKSKSMITKSSEDDAVTDVKESITESETEEQPQDVKEDEIKVLYSSECEKLTTRGVGQLLYEIGYNATTNESFIRITGSGSTGAFSNMWIGINDIQSIIKNTEDETFRAIIFKDLYTGKSSNNHGFLGAVLKHLGVVTSLPDQPTVLYLVSWEPLLEKIESLTLQVE